MTEPVSDEMVAEIARFPFDVDKAAFKSGQDGKYWREYCRSLLHSVHHHYERVLLSRIEADKARIAELEGALRKIAAFPGVAAAATIAKNTLKETDNAR